MVAGTSSSTVDQAEATKTTIPGKLSIQMFILGTCEYLVTHVPFSHITLIYSECNLRTQLQQVHTPK